MPLTLVVRTPDRILLVDRETAKAQQVRLPEVLREEAFQFYQVRDDEFLFITGRRSEGNHDADVYWVGADGTVRRQEQCRLAEGDWTVTNVAMTTAMSFAMPAPIVATGAAVFGSATVNLDSGKATTWGNAVTLAVSQVWPPLAVLWVVSAALAWLCYRRQVRYALPGTAWWVAFVLLGGLPGYLGYRFHRRWVALRQCPHCRQSVPRDREACARCGEAFPLPEKLGTEVFAA